MEYKRVLPVVLIFSLFSLHMLSPTLARYSSEYNASDTAVVAKWDFRIGEDENNLVSNDIDNFNLFSNSELGPASFGENSLSISSGESDVAIEYELLMNADQFKVNDEYYIPLLFRINEDVYFNIKDKNGYFIIAEGILNPDANSKEIKIEWKWDAADYIESESEEKYSNDVLNIINEMETPFTGRILFKVEAKQIKPN